MVSPAEHLVRNFICSVGVSNHNLLTFGDHNATNSSSIVCSPFTTPAKSFNLQGMYPIGKFNETRGSWK
jgi:hypothetical protein